ncbi:MAG TPA: hypothetical protein VEA99_02325, partial [Gemmatimonadaceae bacterium]|nr:hypothetical protein [Gemmatimonadaceae bacterium]
MIGSVGTFSLVLGLVLLLLAAGIIWADISLSSIQKTEAAHDAREARQLLLSRVALKIEWLGAQRALFVSPDPRDRAAFEALAAIDPVADSLAMSGVERVWVLDAAGVVLHDTAYAATQRGAPLDTAALALTRTALASGQARVSTVGNSLATRRVIVARPLSLGSR